MPLPSPHLQPLLRPSVGDAVREHLRRAVDAAKSKAVLPLDVMDLNRALPQRATAPDSLLTRAARALAFHMYGGGRGP